MTDNTTPAPEIEASLAKGIHLPPQPWVLAEIDALLQRNACSLRQLAALVGKDAGLTARVFKVVHSPLFGLRREVSSLEQALSLLGLQPALVIIKGAALRDAVGGEGKSLEAFWERANDIALLCGLIARRQAEVLGIAPGEAHLAGLFHDCGVPILMQRFPGYCQNLHQAWPDLGEEDAAVGTCHAAVGALLARYWKLPESVCRAIRHHHEVADDLLAELPLLAVLLAATHLRNLFYGYAEAGWEKSEPAVLAALGVSPLTRNEFVDEMLAQFEENLSV
jgi:HD-like signal output (HDOD) protein